MEKNAEKYPEVVLRSYSEGHELANHTYSHPFKVSITDLQKELRQTKEIIYSITGFSPVLFRPVGGNYNDSMINAAVKDGYKVVMWSWHQDTQDWKEPGVKKITQKVLKGSKPGDVILFHDGGGDRSQTIKALEEILPELKKAGLYICHDIRADRKQTAERASAIIGISHLNSCLIWLIFLNLLKRINYQNRSGASAIPTIVPSAIPTPKPAPLKPQPQKPKP